MRTLILGINLVALALSSGCTSAQVRDEPSQGVTVQSCMQNPFLRSSGLFGGEQPEIFLHGPDVRREPPPAVDSLTRVLNVSRVESLGDPGSDPFIDKCMSSLQSIDEDAVELTIRWNDRNCPYFDWDDDESSDCGTQASFRFSRGDLGMEEILDTFEDADAGLQKLLVVDAYFTQEIQPTRPHPATGMPLPERGIMHLVVRVVRAPLTVELGAPAAVVDAVREPRR